MPKNDANCTKDDMVNHWIRQFERSKWTSNDSRQMAKNMYEQWVKAGLQFEELVDDYLVHPGYCPKNKKTGKDWFELLNKDEKSEFPPGALILSTINYFKTKGKKSFVFRNCLSISI